VNLRLTPEGDSMMTKINWLRHAMKEIKKNYKPYGARFAQPFPEITKDHTT
jgi:hypothetical protein